MDLPKHLREALDRLLRESEDARRVDLDAIGDAIGTGAVDVAQIEAILDALEANGRTIVASSGGGTGIANLKRVIPAARALGSELGRPARVSEIAERAGMPDGDVRHALLLAKVMGR